MERQLELKVLLKRWEAEFLRERRRKPSQADIEEAPEETRKLYKEYKALKQRRKTSESSGKSSESSGKSSESSGKTLENSSKSLESSGKSSESSGKTLESSGKTLECAGKLLESSGKSSESSGKTSESSGKTAEISGKTLEFCGKTWEFSRKTSESSGKTSESSGKTLENSGKTAKCSGITSECSGKTLENSSKSSERSGKSSENSGKTLESSGITSESSGKTSETSGKTWERAGNSSESSGKSSEIFGKTAEISGKTLESSGKTSESSGKSSENSGKTLESSGKTSESSGKPLECSRKNTENSSKFSESSGKSLENSGKTTESSGKTSESSGKTTESSGKPLECSGKSSESSGTTGSREVPNPEQPEDSGFWGSHLNRAAKIPGKSRSRSPRPGISAEFYGMKLKAKLGATGKEPPLTPRRTPKPPRSQKTPEPGAEPPPPPSRNEEKRENPEIPEGFPELVLPLRLPPGKNRDFPPAPEKFRLLKRRVAETLSSLDPAWIERCREWPEKREFAAAGGEKILEKLEFAAAGGEKIPEKREFAAAGGEKILEKREFAAAGGEKITEKREFAAAGGEKIPPKSRNSGRKRARGGAEAPAKRLRGSDPGISAMGRIQEEEEDGGGISGAAEEIPEKGGKAKGARGARSSAPNSGNFVRLNLKRKIYSRSSLRGKFLRKQVWKRKWRKKFGAASERCFRCGGDGHWAAGCPGLGWTPQNVPEEERPEPEQIPTPEPEQIPTPEAAAPSGGGFVPEAPGDESDTENSPEFPRPPPPVDPLYPLNADGTIPDPPEEVLEALRILGHDSFRPGQAEAIMRVLCGISTLVVLPTGTGKSLCYQLPAFLHHRNSGSICLVISPLVSLMDDQVSGLPSALRAVCVHSNLSQSRREAALEDVRSGRAQILLLSPESLTTAGAFSRFFRNFPPVAFACLDEVHCISQWSHNFRPAYLRVCKVLRELGGVRCFLGLTATATAATLRETAALLRVPEGRGLGVRAPAIPPNLRLSVSVEPDRDRALLRLLRRWRRAPLLLFCSRRRECERLAQLLQDEGTGDGRAAAAYHAGLAPRERGRVQRELAAGAAGVVCATAALGLGLHRGGARGVLHYNAPPSLEAYAQQIGRAGRDGAEATCHLFLDVGDLLELRRHVHENSVDFPTLQTLLRRVFAPCKCREKRRENSEEIPQSPERRRICRGHERSVPVQELVQALDLREEGVQTLLCLLELHPGRLLELFPATRSRCRILAARSRLSSAASSCPPLAFLLAREASGIPGIPGISGISRALEFDAVALSDAMGWEFRTLRRSLGRLAGNGIRVEFRELSFHFRSYGDLEPRELKSVREFLNSRLRERENFELRRLRRCFRTFQSVASLPPAAAESRLRELLLEYFQSEPDEEREEEEEEEEQGVTADQEEEARAEIRKLLCAYPDEEFTGRAVARIFHGIGSPRFPASVFGRDRRFWRRLLPLEFRSLSRLASQEILALK